MRLRHPTSNTLPTTCHHLCSNNRLPRPSYLPLCRCLSNSLIASNTSRLLSVSWDNRYAKLSSTTRLCRRQRRIARIWTPSIRRCPLPQAPSPSSQLPVRIWRWQQPPVNMPCFLLLFSCDNCFCLVGVEAGLSPQDDVSIAGRSQAGAHMGGFAQGMTQHPQGTQQRQHQVQQQAQLFNLKMLESSMENLPEQLDSEKYALVSLLWKILFSPPLVADPDNTRRRTLIPPQPPSLNYLRPSLRTHPFSRSSIRTPFSSSSTTSRAPISSTLSRRCHHSTYSW